MTETYDQSALLNSGEVVVLTKCIINMDLNLWQSSSPAFRLDYDLEKIVGAQ